MAPSFSACAAALLDIRIRFRICDVIFRDIQHIKDRLQRDEIQLLQDFQILFRESKGLCRRPFLQRIEYLFKHRQIELRLLDPCLRELRRLDLLLVDTLQIRQTQLRIDDIHITDRIDRTFYVRDISILEAADDMRDGIRLTDMREELISQTLPLGRARYEAGDIDETSESRRRLLPAGTSPPDHKCDDPGPLRRPHSARWCRKENSPLLLRLL